jgi:excinuclease ABC subunit B
MDNIRDRVAKNERVLVTTLTKKMAEDLTDYLKENGVQVNYMHSEIKTLERIEIIRDLRLGKYDVLVGINLLREGLDIPEVSLVTILDADNEGFLRSDCSLIQTIGRAARNSEGHVILFADKVTDSMQRAIDETERRRWIQMAFNEEHGITPQTIKKDVRGVISTTIESDDTVEKLEKFNKLKKPERETLLEQLDQEMRQAAKDMQFERAAELRDLILELKAGA